MDERALVELARLYANALGVTLWRVGFLAANDGQFFKRLENGRTCTLRSAQSVVQYLSDRWPPDMEWPPEIPRPSPAF